MNIKKRMNGAQIVVEVLKDQGVNHIFGYPGGAVLPIYDELKNHPKIKHILVRHEQGAGHAAEGYARSSGKPGVVLVTSGPGLPVVATSKASCIILVRSFMSLTNQLCFVHGLVIPVVSHSWKASVPIKWVGTCPEMQTKGTESI